METKLLKNIADKTIDGSQEALDELILDWIALIKNFSKTNISNLEADQSLLTLKIHLLDAVDNSFNVLTIKECLLENEILKFNTKI